MNANPLFHAVESVLTPAELDGRGSIREFKGNGTKSLPIPGLKPSVPPFHTIYSVRVGLMDLPLLETREYPSNELGKRAHVKHAVDNCNVQVVLGTDGIPVLLRTILSNDGIWQDGETIRVRAEWDDDVAEFPDTSSDEAVIEAEVNRRLAEIMAAQNSDKGKSSK